MRPGSKARDAHVRCLNCFKRFRPGLKAEEASCPACGMAWRISWPFPDTAKIRGPVWERYADHQ